MTTATKSIDADVAKLQAGINSVISLEALNDIKAASISILDRAKTYAKMAKRALMGVLGLTIINIGVLIAVVIAI